MSLYALTVEDDHIMRITIKKTLLSIGLGIEHVYEAANGKEGLEKLKTHRVGLLLTDINMPLMNGLEMLDHIRKDLNLIKIPTVVISSNKDKKLVAAIAKSGFGFVPKPFRPLLLKQQIQSLKGRYGLGL